MESNIVGIIQAMLAPGIMISACGLLLLGMNNKYSIVVARIRSLNDEKRKLISPAKRSSLTQEEENRLNNINIQTELFAYRVVLVKKAVTSYYIAVAFYILSSLLIGLNFMFSQQFITTSSLVFFLAGMISVVFGIYYASKEIKKGLDIIKVEIEHV